MTWVSFTPVLQTGRLGERTCVMWRDKAKIRTESFFKPNMLESSVLCLAFLSFAKEENWKQLQHLWVGEKLNKVVPGIQGRLHLRAGWCVWKWRENVRDGSGEKSRRGVCRDSAPRVHVACTRLRQERAKCSAHALGGEGPGTWGKGWWQGGAGFNLAYFVLFASFYNEHGFLL